MGFNRVTPKKLRSRLFELQFRNGDLDILARSFGLAYYIISEILGSNWTNSKLSLWENREIYFKSKRQTELEQHQYQGRVMQFADNLFTLQDMQGFEYKVAEILALDKGQIEQLEDLAMELQIAKLIFNSSNNSKFIKRIKNLRTPDIEVPLLENNIYLEIKSRRENVPTTENWIWDHLEEAGSQLKNSPISKQAPTGIFLRVGPFLKDSTNANADGERIADSFLLNNPHVNFIQFVWENWIVNTDGSGGYLIKFKKFNNQKPLYPISGIETLIKEVKVDNISFNKTMLTYSYLEAVK